MPSSALIMASRLLFKGFGVIFLFVDCLEGALVGFRILRMHPFLLYRKMRPIKQKALRAGCAQIDLENILRTHFGAAKHASALKKV